MTRSRALEFARQVVDTCFPKLPPFGPLPPLPIDFPILPEQIADAILRACDEAVREEREACAQLHENIDPACDHEKVPRPVPGAGAMRAILLYRDAIRARGKEGVA